MDYKEEQKAAKKRARKALTAKKVSGRRRTKKCLVTSASLQEQILSNNSTTEVVKMKQVVCSSNNKEAMPKSDIKHRLIMSSIQRLEIKVYDLERLSDRVAGRPVPCATAASEEKDFCLEEFLNATPDEINYLCNRLQESIDRLTESLY